MHEWARNVSPRGWRAHHRLSSTSLKKNTKDAGQQGDEPGQDRHKGDRRRRIHEESTDLLHKGAAELVADQEGPYAGTVAAAAVGLVGTSACSVYPDKAKEHLARYTQSLAGASWG